MAEHVVEVDRVRRSFGRLTALADLTFGVPAGAVTVLVGPNGAGKTTAIRVITGALPVESGSVRVFGYDPAVDGEEVRSRCGVVPASPAFYERLSGRDNLDFAAALYGVSADRCVGESAARFGIEQALDAPVATYSTGMKTRLALARAVLHEPDLLLLDEPTSGLDPESAHAVLDLIDRMAADGKSVVMCTHLLLEADALADHVVILEEGRVFVSGVPNDLVRRYWPVPGVDLEVVELDAVDLIIGFDGVLKVERNGTSRLRIELEDLARVPDLVTFLCSKGISVVRVVPHQPGLEELYLAVRRSRGAGTE